MKKIKFLLVISIWLLLNVTKVNASTDFSDVTIDIKYHGTVVTEENRANAYLVFSGITLDEDMEYRVGVISGDGIGPEVVAEAKKVLESK